MTPQEVLSAAKQGNPQAIAALMNRSLKPKGITAKAKLTDGCLHVMLEGLTVPNQGAIVPYITNGIKGLEIAAVRSLVVYGRVTGEDLPAWSDRAELMETSSTPVVKVSEPEIVTLTAVKPKGSTANKIGLAVTGLIMAFMAWAVAQNIWARSQPSELGLQFEESTKRMEERLAKINKNKQNREFASQEITLDKYNQLETGMTCDQVQQILGASGEESSKNDLAGVTTVMYAWKNPDGSNMNAIFQDDKLVQKAQFGLK